MPMLWSGGRVDKMSNKLAGDVACLGGSMVEDQPCLLGSRVRFPAGKFAIFPFLPKLHFQFPFLLSLPLHFPLSFPFNLSRALKAHSLHLSHKLNAWSSDVLIQPWTWQLHQSKTLSTLKGKNVQIFFFFLPRQCPIPNRQGRIQEKWRHSVGMPCRRQAQQKTHKNSAQPWGRVWNLSQNSSSGITTEFPSEWSTCGACIRLMIDIGVKLRVTEIQTYPCVGTSHKSQGRTPPPPWFEFLVVFDFFAPWYRRGWEASSVKIL